MLQRETMIDDIRTGLAVYQSYVRPGGPLNLTDTNVHAEDFVAGLLNAIHGWRLVSTNQVTANYPCIDLIDEQLNLGLQITAEAGSEKLTKTVECIKSHKLAASVKHLKVFLLIPKQGKYTVSATCPGLAFDWRSDVLDFDDALKSAQAISDLHQLQGVHRHVVSSIPSIFPQYQESPLPLHIPATDPTKAWLAFSSRVTSLVGRENEQARFSAFLNSASKFSWLLITGDAGSGKSRLALELCRQAGDEWHAGFLSRAGSEFKWSCFSPIRSTLIVIDYVASRAEEASDIVLTLSRRSSTFTKPVRILLVEREKSSWWTTFSREDSQSESAEIIACQYGDPLSLPSMSLGAILKIAKEVVDSRSGNWNEEVASDFLLWMYKYDRRGRPLFAMIVALYLEALKTDAATTTLLREVLKREAARRRYLLGNNDELKRMENLLLLTTLVSGLVPKEGSFHHLAISNVAGFLPNMALLDQALHNEMASSTGLLVDATLPGLQPDIVGERYLLDRLSASGIAGQNARALLLAAWSWQPSDLRTVALRCSVDFPGDPAIEILFDLPLDTVEARRYWADIVADFIPYSGESDDGFCQQQMHKLVSIADSHLDELELQQATARAHYHMALLFMFSENRFAIKQFDAAIARAGEASLIAKMAMHNRALVQRADDKSYDAFEVFTTVIGSHDAPDELRACALNNRADLHVERGNHEDAIRDRSEVLSLRETSHDRRFIALFRRSRSYSQLGNTQAALDDLGSILDVWDITPQQKADARLERATILRHQERWDEARADLHAVLASKYLFDGTRAMALVDLAEVSRRTGDRDLAESWLAQATKDPQISTETLGDVIVVGALLLEDAKDYKGAREFWRQLLTLPGVSESQIRIARSHLDTVSQ